MKKLIALLLSLAMVVALASCGSSASVSTGAASADKSTREALVPYGKDPEGVMGKVLGMLKARRFMTFGHENMILVAPPLIITEAQLREELAKLDEVLGEVLGEVDKMI